MLKSDLMSEAINPFPDPREADETGLLCYGGDLSVELVSCAYEKGIFPWPMDAQTPILWFSPPERGVIDFSDLHISRSLQKTINKSKWVYTLNKDFFNVIRACQQTPRPGQASTWITDDLLAIYLHMHRKGIAHSVEVWNEAGDLVGGIYGVQSKYYFSAESMFYRESGASKAAFVYLVNHLRAKSQAWMDVQMLTPASRSLGCKMIKREDFLKRIELSK